MDLTRDALAAIAGAATDRFELWIAFLNRIGARRVAEIGVYRGEFAARVLAGCPALETYFMIDPWRHLEDWNKPANRGDDAFERILQQAMRQTEAHEDRRRILRGRTTEVIGEIADGSLDFAYVDGDHTLRGITVDLQRAYPKLREGGWIGGDDLAPSIWQHGPDYEPTLVFPYAVHFAEGVGATVYALPHRQFLLRKSPEDAFAFVDLTGRYGRTDLLGQASPPQLAASRPAARYRQAMSPIRWLRRKSPGTNP